MSDSTTTVPLTSIFTPPPDCSSSWTYEASDYNGVSSGLLLQNVVQSDIAASCWPSGYTHVGRVAPSFAFSPGACPDGYTTNARAITVDTTTTASCCLSGFYFSTNGIMQGCISTYTGTTFLAARAGGLQTETDYISSTTASGTFQMWAQPLTVIHRSADESLYTTSTSTTASATTTTPTPSSTATSTSSSTSTDTPEPVDTSSGGLSTGAKAGIAVGAAAGALLLVGFAFLFWRRSRKRGVEGHEQGHSQPPVVTRQADYGGHYAASNSTPSELPAKPVASPQLHELQ
ncbi:hypothetical protein BJY00DRAFT_288709 [Aspergillus carlsbadensis]|nr:hypothetical protein BJY00DRAFT_288709 [Aspergillus carlsbadensis]